MSPHWCPGCCEPPGCDVCVDDFARSDGTDVATGSACAWTETAGAWEISSGAVRTSSTTALLTAAASAVDGPDGAASAYPGMHVTARVKLATNGDQARIVFAYVDTNNYGFAELTAGPSGTLRIFRRASGSNTQLATVSCATTAGTWYTLEACVGVNLVSGLIEYRASAWIDALTIHATATYPTTGAVNAWGLGTGGTLAAAVEFDDVDADYARPDCDYCLGCILLTWSATSSWLDDWDSLAGSWSYNFAGDVRTSSANGLVLSDDPNPAGDALVWLAMGLTTQSIGDQARIVVDAVDADNYHCLELTRKGGGATTPTFGYRFIRREAGAETTLQSCQAASTYSTAHRFVLCVAPGRITFRFGSGAVDIIDTVQTTLHGGTRYGWGSGATVGGSVRVQAVEAFRSSDGCKDCGEEYCQGQCTDSLPYELRVTISGLGDTTGAFKCAAGQCAALNGTYIVERAWGVSGSSLENLACGDCSWIVPLTPSCTTDTNSDGVPEGPYIDELRVIIGGSGYVGKIRVELYDTSGTVFVQWVWDYTPGECATLDTQTTGGAGTTPNLRCLTDSATVRVETV